MDASKAKIVALSTIASVIILLAVFWLTLHATKPFFILAAVCFVLILVLCVWILTQFSALDYRRRMSLLRRANVQGQYLRQDYSFLRKVAGLPIKFRYEEVVVATGDFQSVIGQGSSASVYKGILQDGTPVAVKCIHTKAERGERVFQSEVAAIASTQHVNLVRLLGYCVVPNGERYLVYDFVPKGSLNQWIFQRSGRTRKRRVWPHRNGIGNDGGSGGEEIIDDDNETTIQDAAAERCLPWGYRYGVAIDVAKALSYLHHDCRHRILHLDVKPENILLDDDFRARLTDFGVSKLMSRHENRVLSTVRGTRGYLAPEWLLGRGVSEKSDVYSYGMVLLELVGGRRNVMKVEDVDGSSSSRVRWCYFPRIVAEKVREGREMDVVDQRLTTLMQAQDILAVEKEVKALLYVALWCIQEEPKLRPSMTHVVGMLEGRMPIIMPPETKMVVIDLMGIDDTSQSRLLGPSGDEQPPPTSGATSAVVSILSPR